MLICLEADGRGRMGGIVYQDSGSKREATSSLILLASFCHHVAEAEGAR